MRGIFCAFLAAAAAASVSSAELKPTLQATFDRDFRAMTSRGSVEGKHSTKLTMETLSMLLEKGVKGKAARVGAELIGKNFRADYIHYPGSVLKADSGTIAFWLNPLDWDFKDGKYHVFCEAKSRRDWLTVYKYCDNRELFFLFGTTKRGGNGVSYVIAAAPASTWEKGTFRHVAATWDKQNIRLYLDGVLKSTVKIPASCMPEKFDTLSVGPRSATAWKNHAGYSLIDDFHVYDKALNAAEVEELFASYNFKKIDKSKIPVAIPKVKMNKSADGKKLDLLFSLTRTTTKRTGFPVVMDVFQGKKKIMSKTLTSSSTEYIYSFEIDKMLRGEYQLKLLPQKELPTDKISGASFIFSTAEAKFPVDHTVPAPWKAVTYKNGELTARMQKTVFKEGLLPAQLFSEKTPLLTKGMRFLCNGRELTGKAAVKVIEKYPDFQIIERKVSGKDFDLISRCRFEFDGMMWFDITLAPKGKFAVKNAKIEIPLKKEVSTLYNKMAKDYFKFRGFTTAGSLNKKVTANHFTTDDPPIIWVGNEERGLYYFTQDQSGRRLKNRNETISLVPGKAETLFNINLIDHAGTLEKPVTWSMGLQVTPMRPAARKRTVNRPEHSIALWFPWEKIHNVPDARFKKDGYEKRRKGWSNNNRLPLFHYFAGFSVSPENPGYPMNAADWSLTPPAVGTEFSPNSREWRYAYICANSAKFRSTYLRDMEKCIRDLKIDNLYFDNCWSSFCNNPVHGCGWRDDKGRLHATFNVLGNREIAKGCYRLLKKAYPDGMVARHISQQPEPPLVAFADSIVDGECFMMDIGKDENYYNVFKPDYFRAAFMGVQFGLPSIYIAQFNRAYTIHFPEKLAKAKAGKLKNQQTHLRHFMGYALAHDSDVWANFGVDAKSIWKIMDKYGVWDENPFWGYWNKKNPVKKVSPAGERIMVSSYACHKGVLTVLLNDTDKPVTVKLALDAAVLGKSPDVINAENGSKADPAGIQLAAREFKLIRITKK